jgi:hypothetical protein
MTAMRVNLFAGFAVLIIAGWTSPAHAYLDPGTGSMIVQAIIGGIAGVTVIIGIYWRKVRSFFSSKRDVVPKIDDGTDKQ